jgi:hypothetical protein
VVTHSFKELIQLAQHARSEMTRVAAAMELLDRAYAAKNMT